ncbi:hypothetical protein [Streptomyces sp. 7N604]|uniref:hypothetical protein n=1 Tax=Streptomyces sp. 7N604 TaxID=3457415 RepID=UPI003FD4A6F0
MTPGTRASRRTFGLTESVILIRRAAPDRDPSGLADATADAALRLAGTAERSLPKLRREGQGLVAARSQAFLPDPAGLAGPA